MNAERWERIESICLAALDRPAEEREPFLASACGDDDDLRGEVESLLRVYDQDPDYLETPVARVAELSQDHLDGRPDAPRFIGANRLVRLLGRGGMGEVYLAVQETDEFTRSVALKVIRRGLDTEDVLWRSTSVCWRFSETSLDPFTA